MKRRRFLGLMGGLMAAGAVGAAGFRYWPDEGLWNPCLEEALPEALRNHDIMRAAFAGIDPAALWDCHVHLIGTGDSDSGIRVNPRMASILYPLEYAQFTFYQNAACVAGAAHADDAFVARLLHLLADFPAGARAMLLAFDYCHNERGERVAELSPFYTPNEYAARLHAAHSDRFEWIASIHPYREDCVEALDWAVIHGARAVKWLPQAQGMDPASPLCDRFYTALARHDIPLLSHTGSEHAVRGGGGQDAGNPLRLRRALDQGVRVIVAHCASLGEGIDLDRGSDGSKVSNFELFARLLRDPEYRGRLAGDISAVAQVNRSYEVMRALLRRDELRGRLLYGSDYPLPGVMPLFSVRGLASEEFITNEEAAALSVIRRYNPLLFNFALMRLLRAGEARFGDEVFATREFFTRAEMPEKTGLAT